MTEAHPPGQAGGWWTEIFAPALVSVHQYATLDHMKNHKKATADTKAIRRGTRELVLVALRDGRKVRATTFKNRKREAARKACRGRQDQ